MNDFTNEIKNIKFKGLEDIKCNEALKSVSVYKDINYVNIFKNIIKYTIKKTNTFLFNGSPQYIFIFSNSYSTRHAYEILFEKVVNVVTNSVQIKGKIKFELSFRKINNLKYLLVWLKQLKHTTLSYKTKLYIASELLLGLNDSQQIMKFITKNKEDIHLVTTFCDCHCIDYIVTSKVNDLNISTATLQHGMFEIGWKFGYSHSDYFLAHGEYAKKLAIQSGLKENQVISVGMMQYINTVKKVSDRSFNFKTLGIILSSPENEKENNYLIQFANYIKEKYRMTNLVRLHPALKIEDYKKNIENMQIDKSSSIIEFSEKADIILMGNTTVFSELMILKKICLRFIGLNNCYIGIDDFSFDNIEQLDNLMEQIKGNINQIYEQIEKVAKYLMPEGDTKIYYKQFFDKF